MSYIAHWSALERRKRREARGTQVLGMVEVPLARKIGQATALALVAFLLMVSVCINPTQPFSLVVLGICEF